MELRHYAALLWRWAWLIVLCTALAGGVAYSVSKRSVPIYAAATTLLISQAPADTTADYTSLLVSERLARTYAELLRTRPVMEGVIAELGLDLSPDALADMVRVVPVRDTQLLVLTVEDPNPRRAARIANATVAVFSRQHRAFQESRYTASKQSLQQELARVQADIDRVQAQLDALRSVTTPERSAETDRLETRLAQHRNSYTTLLKSFEEVRLAEARTLDTVSVVEEARPDHVPVRPRPLLNTLLAAIVGTMLALGTVFLIESLDDSVKSGEAIEALTGLATLGAIAPIPSTDPAGLLVASASPQSPVVEAYRVLRANIEFSRVERPIRSLLVTSCGPQEGKSTTAANLAVVMAHAGYHTILVDADLRRPSLHTFFHRSGRRGLTTALLGEAGSAHDHLVPTAVERLHLLPSGVLPPNPAELLGSQRMVALLAELQAEADIVLFDSPPLLAVADTALLAQRCDATLLVVLPGATRAETLRHGTERLEQAGTRLLGAVLNRVSHDDGNDYYRHYYGARPRQRWKQALVRRWPFPVHADGHKAEG